MNKQRSATAGSRRRDRRVSITWLVATALFSCASAAWAHHSFAMYEVEKSVSVRGVVKEFRFGNPHTLIIIAVQDHTDALIDYTIETNGSFNLAKNQGWKRDSLRVGDAVVALVRPLRDGSPGGDLLKLTFNDGRELIARPPPWPNEEKR